MKSKITLSAILLVTVAVMAVVCAATATAQTAPDRTTLPVPEPQYPHSTVLDVRNAPPPPPRFEVKAPASAPNVLIVLIDDMGFGQSGCLRRPPQHADRGPSGQEWSPLQPVPHDRPVFTDPGSSPYRAQSPYEQHGLDHGDRHGLSRATPGSVPRVWPRWQ